MKSLSGADDIGGAENDGVAFWRKVRIGCDEIR
jgi:hypothetical protein